MDNIFKACTHFIEDFNEIASLKSLPQSPQLLPEKEYTLNYLLMKEELEEYLTACLTGDLKEIADAAGDMLFVLWGIIAKHGMQHVFLEKVLLPICLSNKTKTCSTREKASQSLAKYKDAGREVVSIEKNGMYGIFDANTMKLLKGVDYKAPDIVI